MESGLSRRFSKIRDMDRADVRAASVLHAAIDPSPWSEQQFLESLDAGAIAKALTIEQKLIGFLLLNAVVDQVEILTFGVQKSEQGKGWGRLLLEQTLFDLPRSLSEIFLEVRVSNRPARNLYESLGFELVGMRRNYYALGGGLFEDGLVMKRGLPLR